MKTIYLQRQGSTENYNTNNSINSQLGYYIEVETRSNKKYRIKISSKRDKMTSESKYKSLEIDGVFSSLSEVFRRIEKEMREEFSEVITIANIIEMYCHANFTYGKNEDKYLVVCFYELSTETIRLYPENYCLVSFKHKGTKNYLQMDSVTAQYLPLLKKQAAQHEKEKGWYCHIDKSQDFLRERFAWLIGEAIKEQNNQIPFYIADTLMK